MKRIFYISGTLFFLSLTLLVGVHIGQKNAEAQGKSIVGYSAVEKDGGVYHYFLMRDGEIWAKPGSSFLSPFESTKMYRLGNPWEAK